MKNIIFLVSLLSFTLSTAIHAAKAVAESEPTRVFSSYHTSYIPHGFDTNDNTQIVAEGSFTNSCYRPAGFSLNVDHQSKIITVSPRAYRYNGYCLMMIVDYSEVIDLGLLNIGNYDIVQKVNDEEKYFGQISIRAAVNSEADDYVYAPIEQAYYEKVVDKNKITLTGNFTNSCMKMAEVLVSTKDNVVVVQPISEVTSEANCKEGRFPFIETTEFNVSQGGRYLLHIRSMNSNSINNLIDIR